ncbi:MAG TPA: hypothetical protein VNZ22_07400 [Bacillota bacterium]|nr:hypothetical protein [Bacillota bacterium]
MERKPKLLLVSAILCVGAGLVIASGLVNVQRFPAFYVVLPVGVILAGMFLVTRLFEKESKVAVDDQQRVLSQAGMDVPRDETPAKQGAVLAK